jgi:hypothetical protein
LAKRGKALFKSVCLGKCKSRDLPARLNLSNLAPEMNRLWEASIREIKSGVVREHAALLVWEREGLRLTNIVEGTNNEVDPDNRLQQGQQFVGTFHTHPYVRGWQGVAFSGADIASTIADGENLSIVHSGTQIFALARTELASQIIDEEELEETAQKLVKSYMRSLSLPDAVLKMNIALSKRHHLSFYLGNTTGKLKLKFKP